MAGDVAPPAAGHDLHAELALLLTDQRVDRSPKLVRLSHDNLDSNAAAIAESLGVRATDRAITSLPLHYCYGLSVVHSHLSAGAAVVLTDLSVVDPCFWTLFDEVGATTLAGVPHSFDLLDRSGFAAARAPDAARRHPGRWPARARTRCSATPRSAAERGWDLFVMYGQTEATARMAVLPPDLLETRPGDGRSARARRLVPARPARASSTAGWASSSTPAPTSCSATPSRVLDLARGRERARAAHRRPRPARRRRPGRDRRSPEPVRQGRRVCASTSTRSSATSPPTGHETHCVDLGDAIGVLVAAPGSRRRGDATRDPAARHTRVGVVVLDGLEAPRLATGKPDYPGMAELIGAHRARAAQEPAEEPSARSAGDRTDAVVALYRVAAVRTAGRPRRRASSTSAATRCPTSRCRCGWSAAATPARRLAPPAPDRAGRGGSRAGDAPAPGGGCTPSTPRAGARRGDPAHPGQPHPPVVRARWRPHPAGPRRLQPRPLPAHLRPRRERVRGIVRSVTRVVLPSAAWIGVVALVAGTYDWRNVLMLNQVLGDWAQWSDHWHYWFVEAVTSLLLGTALLMAIPAVDRWERRWPFAFPVALVGLGPADAVCRAGARRRALPGRQRLRAHLAVRDRLGRGPGLHDAGSGCSCRRSRC